MFAVSHSRWLRIFVRFIYILDFVCSSIEEEQAARRTSMATRKAKDAVDRERHSNAIVVFSKSTCPLCAKVNAIYLHKIKKTLILMLSIRLGQAVFQELGTETCIRRARHERYLQNTVIQFSY